MITHCTNRILDKFVFLLFGNYISIVISFITRFHVVLKRIKLHKTFSILMLAAQLLDNFLQNAISCMTELFHKQKFKKRHFSDLPYSYWY